MRIGTSLALIAVGLVLSYAIDFELPGIELGTLGAILFFIGLLGLAVSVGLEVMDHRARSPRPARPPRDEPRRREPAPQPRERWDPVVPPNEARRAKIDPAEDRTRRLR